MPPEKPSHPYPRPRKSDFGKAFAFGVALNLLLVAAQTIAGLLAHSLALLADATHNFADVLGLLLAWGAEALARRQPTGRWTYGFRAGTILAALANVVLLFMAVGGVAWEALRRLGNPGPVNSGLVMGVAGLGILINAASAIPFYKGGHKD